MKRTIALATALALFAGTATANPDGAFNNLTADGLFDSSPSSTRGWFISGNEIGQGYNYAADDTAYINYSGYHQGTTYYRNTFIGDGKTNPMIYAQASTGRIGIGTSSPSYKLDVNGGQRITGDLTLGGDFALSTTSTLSLGPLGGNGGFYVNPVTGQQFVQPITSASTYKWGFGFGNETTPQAPIDVASLPYDPGTTNGRTDNYETMIHGLALSNYALGSTYKRVTDIFFDASHTQVSGTGKLHDVLMRLDANGPAHGGGVDAAWALWIDKGDLVLNSHFMVGVRADTGGGPTTPPTVSACGTSPTRDGTDTFGYVNPGTGSPTSCTITFVGTWADHSGASVTPVCFVQADDGKVPTITTRSSTTLTWTWTGTETQWHWYCGGIAGAIPADS